MAWRNPFTKYRCTTDNWHTMMLRIRAGARHACARLRRERDAAREAAVYWSGRFSDHLERLTALEWVLRNHPDSALPDDGGIVVSIAGKMTYFGTYHDAARELGMPEGE